MEESTVTYIWMGGVIAVMLAYVAIASVGLIKQRNAKKKNKHNSA